MFLLAMYWQNAPKEVFYWMHLELDLYSGGTQFALDITKFCGYKQLLYWQEAI